MFSPKVSEKLLCDCDLYYREKKLNSLKCGDHFGKKSPISVRYELLHFFENPKTIFLFLKLGI